MGALEAGPRPQGSWRGCSGQVRALVAGKGQDGPRGGPKSLQTLPESTPPPCVPRWEAPDPSEALAFISAVQMARPRVTGHFREGPVQWTESPLHCHSYRPAAGP